MARPLLSALLGDAEIESLLSDQARLDAMLRVEVALAEASAETNWITPAAAGAIVAAISAYRPDWSGLAAGMSTDGVDVPALLTQLRLLIPEPHHASLHRGATSQDIVDTALILQLTKVLDILDGRLATLTSRLGQRIDAEGAKPLVAHTRMQVALPTLWREKLESWRRPLVRHRQALAALRPALLVIQLGGPVGDRASFDGHGDAIAAAAARRLDIGVAPPWHTARDSIVALGSLLALITGSLGKIGADVALLAQNEIGAVTLDGGRSSAMPHKSNPVNAEVLVTLARFNAGLAGTLQHAMVHEYERSGAAWTLEWMVLPQMIVAAGASLRIGVALTEALRIA